MKPAKRTLTVLMTIVTAVLAIAYVLYCKMFGTVDRYHLHHPGVVSYVLTCHDDWFVCEYGRDELLWDLIDVVDGRHRYRRRDDLATLSVESEEVVAIFHWHGMAFDNGQFHFSRDWWYIPGYLTP